MSTLRRYTPLAKSRGTEIPSAVRNYVKARDNGHCVGRIVGFPTVCLGRLEIDHVRSSGGIGMKSPSEAWNLVSLCGLACHKWKTEHPRQARPLLIAWLERVEGHMPESIW